MMDSGITESCQPSCSFCFARRTPCTPKTRLETNRAGNQALNPSDPLKSLMHRAFSTTWQFVAKLEGPTTTALPWDTLPPSRATSPARHLESPARTAALAIEPPPAIGPLPTSTRPSRQPRPSFHVRKILALCSPCSTSRASEQSSFGPVKHLQLQRADLRELLQPVQPLRVTAEHRFRLVRRECTQKALRLLPPLLVARGEFEHRPVAAPHHP